MVRLGFSCPQVNMPCFLLRLGDLMGWPCVFFSRLLLLLSCLVWTWSSVSSILLSAAGVASVAAA